MSFDSGITGISLLIFIILLTAKLLIDTKQKKPNQQKNVLWIAIAFLAIFVIRFLVLD